MIDKEDGFEDILIGENQTLSNIPLEGEKGGEEDEEDEDEKENEYIKMLIRQETGERFTGTDEKLTKLNKSMAEVIENDNSKE